MSAPRIDVWICARPDATQLDASSPRWRPRARSRGSRSRPPDRGSATARNEALARCDGDVLALVEDDVEVAHGLARRAARRRGRRRRRAAGLRRRPAACGVRRRPAGVARRRAPARVRRRPRSAARTAPPAVPVVVDAAKRTFHGGNISFRAAALRGVGGFWPARGHPGLRDWFGEEHRAQHELARAGWSAAWVPAARSASHRSRAERAPARRRAAARAIRRAPGAVGPPDAAPRGAARRRRRRSGCWSPPRGAMPEARRARRSCGAATRASWPRRCSRIAASSRRRRARRSRTPCRRPRRARCGAALRRRAVSGATVAAARSCCSITAWRRAVTTRWR